VLNFIAGWGATRALSTAVSSVERRRRRHPSRNMFERGPRRKNREGTSIHDSPVKLRRCWDLMYRFEVILGAFFKETTVLHYRLQAGGAGVPGVLAVATAVARAYPRMHSGRCASACRSAASRAFLTLVTSIARVVCYSSHKQLIHCPVVTTRISRPTPPHTLHRGDSRAAPPRGGGRSPIPPVAAASSAFPAAPGPRARRRRPGVARFLPL